VKVGEALTATAGVAAATDADSDSTTVVGVVGGGVVVVVVACGWVVVVVGWGQPCGYWMQGSTTMIGGRQSREYG
jgi:hypothetical protein